MERCEGAGLGNNEPTKDEYVGREITQKHIETRVFHVISSVIVKIGRYCGW